MSSRPANQLDGDDAEAHEFVDRAESGVVTVIEKTTGLDRHVPFGGMKRSSTNTVREQGDAAIDVHTRSKTESLNREVGLQGSFSIGVSFVSMLDLPS